MILAAAEPLLSIYRSVNSHPQVAATAIAGNAEALSDADLAAAARSILDELFTKELAAMRALFEQRAIQQRTTTDIAQAARAASRGAVQTLLIDIDEVIPGTMDDDGAVSFAQSPCATTYDLVDEIAGRRCSRRARPWRAPSRPPARR